MNRFCIIYNTLAAVVAVALAVINALWQKPHWCYIFVALAILNVIAAYIIYRLDRNKEIEEETFEEELKTNKDN